MGEIWGSLIEAIITCVSLATAHTRTMPSAPPLSSRLQSLEQQTAVTPFLGVSPPEELPTWRGWRVRVRVRVRGRGRVRMKG